MSRLGEVEGKVAEVRELMTKRGLDAFVLWRVSSFAWVTAGAPSYVSLVGDLGEAAVLLTATTREIFTNVIEGPRLRGEVGLAADGWTFTEVPWEAIGGVAEELRRRTAGMKVGSDVDRPGWLAAADDIRLLRSSLVDEEITRLRDASARCADAMKAGLEGARPGQSEEEIAGVVARELVRRGVAPVVLQTAADERIFAYRHLLPTPRVLDRYLFVSFCGRRHGLTVSMTRLVYFGRLPPELRRKMEATARVDAALLAATTPGALLADVFAAGCAAYAEAGVAGEWRRHHQGGVAGYEGRELLVTAATREAVRPQQAFAWNPTIEGTKSEDTVLSRSAGDEGACEVLTAIAGWPTIAVDIGQATLARPAILEVLA